MLRSDSEDAKNVQRKKEFNSKILLASEDTLNAVTANHWGGHGQAMSDKEMTACDPPG